VHKGTIVIEKERCKGCQLCLEACPKRLILLSEEFNARGYHFAVFDESGECTACVLCGRICPDMAIVVYACE